MSTDYIEYIGRICFSQRFVSNGILFRQNKNWFVFDTLCMGFLLVSRVKKKKKWVISSKTSSYVCIYMGSVKSTDFYRPVRQTALLGGRALCHVRGWSTERGHRVKFNNSAEPKVFAPRKFKVRFCSTRAHTECWELSGYELCG